MVVTRIVAALTELDKLRYFVAMPAGAAAGLWLGYHLGQPDVTAADVVMAVAVLGLAVWLGLSAPRPTPIAKTTRSQQRASSTVPRQGK